VTSTEARAGLAVAAAAVAVAGCVGDDSAATTAAVDRPTPTTPAQSGSAPALGESIATRLRGAGYRVVARPRPKGVPGVARAFVTPTGAVVVYVYVFAAVRPAKAYAAQISAQARRSRGGLLGRRVVQTVYVGAATDAIGRGQLRTRLDRLVAAGGG
jgi:hypothetical protein